jgi:catechol-2,3-dioxygenase
MREHADGFYDHLDWRVGDLKKVSRLYDALMPALGFDRIRRSPRSRSYRHADRSAPFLWVVQAKRHLPGLSRLAFGVPNRKDVDRIARIIRRAGAKKIEGPMRCPSYEPRYYAIFFEDPEGNKLEVCCRR